MRTDGYDDWETEVHKAAMTYRAASVQDASEAFELLLHAARQPAAIDKQSVLVKGHGGPDDEIEFTIEGGKLKSAKWVSPSAEQDERGAFAEAWEMDWPEYSYDGMGCGLEDRNITDRYDAMKYGWDEAMERVGQILERDGPLYAAPLEKEASKPAAQVTVYPQGVMGIPPYSPPGSGSMTVEPGISWNSAAPSVEQDERGAFEAWASKGADAVVPTLYQYRTKPTWTGGRWCEWTECKAEAAADYSRVPLLHDWAYEVRELFEHAALPAQTALTDDARDAARWRRVEHQYSANEIDALTATQSASGDKSE